MLWNVLGTPDEDKTWLKRRKNRIYTYGPGGEIVNEDPEEEDEFEEEDDICPDDEDCDTEDDY